jgi:hypothetical protein
MKLSLSNSEIMANDRASGWRFVFLYVVPTIALLIFALWPIIAGGRTLFFRDVTGVHLEMKWFQAQAMKDGYLPIIDPYRGGGQPHLGNPNTVALYPDNVLYLVADTFWALNAHFWIHLLLAPFTLFWLARAWGLGREAAWAGGVAFALSGYLLSGFNLYNMIATMVWAPALAAVAISLTGSAHRIRWLWLTALVWALLVVSGDPVTAVLALVLALTAVAAKHGLRGARWGGLVAALGLGTMLAAPLVLEFLRVLSLSFRGHWGYSVNASLVGSWHPMRILEWFLPLAFGQPDLSYWGFRFHSENLPLLYSLSPGFIAMALGIAGYRSSGPIKRWAVWMFAAGVFFALGGFNPIFVLLLKLPGAGLLRLPVKFWLFAAVGGSMLAALGVERLLASGEDSALKRAMSLVAGLLVALWLVLVLVPEAIENQLREWMPSASLISAGDIRLRWAGLALLTILLAISSLIVLRLGRARLRWVVPVLLVVHVSSQLFLLRSLYESDQLAPYREPSPAADIIPEGARVVHGAAGALFETSTIRPQLFPTRSVKWNQRAAFQQFYPVAGIMAGRRFEFFMTPEGLDSFLARAGAQAIERLDDPGRIRMLAVTGVEWLLLERELDAAVLASGDVELAGGFETVAGFMHVYRLPRVAADAQFVGTLHSSAHLNEALSKLLAPDFDPQSEAVLEGQYDQGPAATGSVVTRISQNEHLEWDVEARGAGALLVQRSYLPHYRAWVDGESVPIRVANLSRMAILLEPGSHTVELRVDRSRLYLGLGVSFVALVILVALSRSGMLSRWLGLRQDNGDQ